MGRFFLCLTTNEAVEMVEMDAPAWLGALVESVTTGERYRVENYMKELRPINEMEVLAWAAS